jgi:hypothetical protein
MKVSALGTGLGTIAETRNDASKTSSEIDDRNQTEKQFISSQAFHRTPGGRVQKITAGVQFKPRILESFDPATQEQYRFHPASNPHTQSETSNLTMASKRLKAENSLLTAPYQ